MALSSEIAVEENSKWEIGPTNDVVLAFIETLVDPRLPYTFSINDPPSEDAQKSIARQVYDRVCVCFLLIIWGLVLTLVTLCLCKTIVGSLGISNQGLSLTFRICWKL